ncbi:MAG: ABC transporter ATP-binding protein/permease [Fuerstiella sp.]|nr:ABC transporter ATP-binding protein/permease [Fuerstiella sp.]
MSEANPFSRLISARQLFRPTLLGATVCAVAASVCLVGFILCVGAIAALIQVEIAGQSEIGLLQVLQSGTVPERILRQLIDYVPLMHTSLPSLAIAGLVFMGLRWLLQAAVSSQVSAHASARVRRLRQHLHRQSLRLNAGDLRGERVDGGRRLFRETADQVETSVHQWGRLTISGVSDLVALPLTCCLVHFYAGMECMIPVVAGWFLMMMEEKRLSNTSDLLTEQVNRSLNRLADGLEKSRIVAGYGMEAFEHEQFETNLNAFGQRRRQVSRELHRGIWVNRVILIFAVGAPAWILLQHLQTNDQIGLAGITIIGIILVLLYQTLRALQRSHDYELQGSVAAEEIDEYIRSVPDVSQIPRARFHEPMSRSLQFDQICVDTPDHPNLLNQLDLKIEAGQRVALISLRHEETSGLVSLVPRLNDPQSGQVLLDGRNIRHATLESLRAESMIVSGTNNLFNATVLENITCGQVDISRQQAMEAGKVAHTEKFTRQLPNGYETQIGDYGVPLDAGQAFRLAIARAIVRKPALLFLEEPHVSLDSETKALLDDTYDRICQDRTVVFLPFRLSTVKKCDRVVLLNDGRVVADGTHEELVLNSELYRHWEYVRFNVFQSGE